jgi:hypothetical protein
MDAELKEHRRLSQAFKCYLEPCFNQHLALLAARSKAHGQNSASRANLVKSSLERKRMRRVCVPGDIGRNVAL